jgi:hypothetical protein
LDQVICAIDLLLTLKLVLDVGERLPELGAHFFLHEAHEVEQHVDRPGVDRDGRGDDPHGPGDLAEEVHHALGNAPISPLLLPGLVLWEDPGEILEDVLELLRIDRNAKTDGCLIDLRFARWPQNDFAGRVEVGASAEVNGKVVSHCLLLQVRSKINLWLHKPVQS